MSALVPITQKKPSIACIQVTGQNRCSAVPWKLSYDKRDCQIICGRLTTFIDKQLPSIPCLWPKKNYYCVHSGNKVEQVVSSTLKDVYDERDCRIIRGRPTTFIDMQLPSSPRHAYGCIITHGEPFTEPTVHVSRWRCSFYSVMQDVTCAASPPKTSQLTC